MNSILSGFSLSLFVESHLLTSSRQGDSLSRAEAAFLCVKCTHPDIQRSREERKQRNREEAEKQQKEEREREEARRAVASQSQTKEAVAEKRSRTHQKEGPQQIFRLQVSMKSQY